MPSGVGEAPFTFACGGGSDVLLQSTQWGARLRPGRECQECEHCLEVILHGQRLRQSTMSPWNFGDMLRDRQRLTFLQEAGLVLLLRLLPPLLALPLLVVMVTAYVRKRPHNMEPNTYTGRI